MAETTERKDRKKITRLENEPLISFSLKTLDGEKAKRIMELIESLKKNKQPFGLKE